ncbi:MAG TPA: NUDIX domain-containing protein [Candidatus Nanoarchaeia archaeon]|nr:NUDIX domain-containing protein [Candidatus Nanoarchaeia archaeon]
MEWTSAQWEELYESNNTIILDELGLGNFSQTKVIVTSKPEELQSVEEKIQQFWANFVQSHPLARDDLKLGVRGKEDIYVQEGILVVKAFPTSYAAVRFKNSRSKEDTKNLDEEQQDFLDNHFLTIGAGAYVTADNQYLLGKRATGVARSGLVEYVPQGLADPHGEENLENIFDITINRELEEETGLGLGDISERKSTHVNIGPKYGDFTLIYHIAVRLEAVVKVKANPYEHTNIFWKTEDALQELMCRDRYAVTPVTTALFDKIL